MPDKVIILISILGALSCSPKHVDQKVRSASEYAKLFKLDQEGVGLSIYTSDRADIPVFTWNGKTIAENIVCLSFTQISYLDALGKISFLKGVPHFNGIYDDTLRLDLSRKKIAQTGVHGSNTEQIIELQPDLIIFSAQSDLSNMSHLKNLGFSRMPFLAHLENHPLGRLEWVKCFGVITGSLNQAISYYDIIADKYHKLVATNEKAVHVFVGYNWNNSWYVAGGNSYMAQFVKDAGGRFLLANDHHRGNFNISREHAIELLARADVWLHPGYGTMSYDEIRHIEALEKLTKPNLRIYNNNKRTNKNKANDFWQSGIVRPDLVLTDLKKIVAGEDDGLIYYRRM
ncbi:MAG: ABC transporter substrate-binding protein [Cytophagales bacterium]|nr:ABC transporter substrate-binding protein [Cytophagales bacterium]